VRKTPPDLKPKFVFLRMEETSFWDKKLLEEKRIDRVYSVYLYDENEVTYLCEITPSYALYYCDFCFEMAEGAEDYSEEAYDFLLEGSAGMESDTSYVKCSCVDRMTEKDRSIEGYDVKPYSDMNDEEYADLVDEIIGDYRSNPTW